MNKWTHSNCTFILHVSYRRHRARAKQIKMKDLKIFQNTWLSPTQSVLEVWVEQQLPVGVSTVMLLVQVCFLNTSLIYLHTPCCSLHHRWITWVCKLNFFKVKLKEKMHSWSARPNNAASVNECADLETGPSDSTTSNGRGVQKVADAPDTTFT